MPYDPRIPYDELPPLPPEKEVETRNVLKQCLGATRALAELKGIGDLIQNQAILINAIPLQEAKLSSEIENIVTTQDELYKAVLDEGIIAAPQTKEVLRYRTALRHGFDEITKNRFSIGLIREVCSILRGIDTDFRSSSENVYIGNPITRQVHYTPPAGGVPVSEKLDNLEQFLLMPEDKGPDPLVRMAMAHYQFEAIHPFIDGNGRS